MIFCQRINYKRPPQRTPSVDSEARVLMSVNPQYTIRDWEVCFAFGGQSKLENKVEIRCASHDAGRMWPRRCRSRHGGKADRMVIFSIVCSIVLPLTEYESVIQDLPFQETKVWAENADTYFADADALLFGTQAIPKQHRARPGVHAGN